MSQPRRSVLRQQLFVASLVLFLVANTISHLGNFVSLVRDDVAAIGAADSHNAAYAASPPTGCTRDQLLAVRAQLHPTDCVKAVRDPWLQSCSLTAQTKCPDPANWLDEYYSELQREYALEEEQQQQLLLRGGEFASPFLAISVGCNKGFDALNTLRMGTFDASLSKSDWNDAMTAGEEKIHQSVCKQDATPEFEIIGQLTSVQGGDGKVRRGRGGESTASNLCRTHTRSSMIRRRAWGTTRRASRSSTVPCRRRRGRRIYRHVRRPGLRTWDWLKPVEVLRSQMTTAKP